MTIRDDIGDIGRVETSQVDWREVLGVHLRP